MPWTRVSPSAPTFQRKVGSSRPTQARVSSSFARSAAERGSMAIETTVCGKAGGSRRIAADLTQSVSPVAV